MKVFLDDYRHPRACTQYMHSRIGPLNVIYLDEWMIVKNYQEFVDVVSKNYKEITYISLDHDLADEHYTPEDYWEDYNKSKAYQESRYYKEKTGFDCAKWMIEFYKEKNKSLPKVFVHSMNPVGTDNIIKLFEEELRDYNNKLKTKI